MNAAVLEAKSFYELFVAHLTTYGMRIIGAVLLLVVGLQLAVLIRRNVLKNVRRVEADQILVHFLVNLSYAAAIIFVVIGALNVLGVQTTSVITVIGAAGLAVALALQGSLANLAAGILIIVEKYFRIGDYIEAGGASGMVMEVNLFTTLLQTTEGRKVIVPNAKIVAEKITVYPEPPTPAAPAASST
ncbi:MAG: mechanosensitive ion channel [Candidatus Tectomicrobia bacterium]|uniref:Mechanosensitive ion channel n=1 Tax=Tectimicrobiota bacterium TaxID=2528274 RepID=A0A932FV30_UNCTE|nr:mechanosensitive ion channel [Candidatus Tectomicrobia bacterium]